MTAGTGDATLFVGIVTEFVGSFHLPYVCTTTMFISLNVVVHTFGRNVFLS